MLELRGVPQLEGRSFQQLLVPQPVKLGGFNLRSLVETRFPAFIGGLEQALHFMVVGDKQEKVVSPLLREAVGSMEGQHRWAEFLAADSRTAREFREAWVSLSAEAAATWAYLGEEPSGPLSAAVEVVGGSSVDGSTRSRIVQQREAMSHELLTLALARHRDREARPVTVYQNISDDKCAGSWLLAIPSPDLSLSTKVFQEAMSSHLCLPSPELMAGGWVGKPVGSRGETVDKFGDSVQCCNEIPGDSWRKRHDGVKQLITAESALAAVPVAVKSTASSVTFYQPPWKRREVSSSGGGLARAKSLTSSSSWPLLRDQRHASQN